MWDNVDSICKSVEERLILYFRRTLPRISRFINEILGISSDEDVAFLNDNRMDDQIASFLDGADDTFQDLVNIRDRSVKHCSMLIDGKGGFKSIVLTDKAFECLCISDVAWPEGIQGNICYEDDPNMTSDSLVQGFIGLKEPLADRYRFVGFIQELLAPLSLMFEPEYFRRFILEVNFCGTNVG
jgi:hypothetical protein